MSKAKEITMDRVVVDDVEGVMTFRLLASVEGGETYVDEWMKKEIPILLEIDKNKGTVSFGRLSHFRVAGWVDPYNENKPFPIPVPLEGFLDVTPSPKSAEALYEETREEFAKAANSPMARKISDEMWEKNQVHIAELTARLEANEKEMAALKAKD